MGFRGLYLLFNLLLPSLVLATETCESLLGYVQESDPEKRVQIVSGQRIKYDHNPDRYRLDAAYLVLSSRDDLELVAEVIAQGRNPAKVLKQLKKLTKKTAQAISLKDIAPDMVQVLTNKTAECDGPNCWNATLNWYAPKIGVRYIGRNKMERRLHAYFEPISELSDLRFGDTISIRHNTVLVHTMIYLGSGIVWHKASAIAVTPWTFEMLEDALGYYQKSYPRGWLAVDFFRWKGRPD